MFNLPFLYNYLARAPWPHVLYIPFINLFIYPCICTFFHPSTLLSNAFIHPSICSFIHPFFHHFSLLHQPSLFKYFHKQHHMWHAPCVMATFYCHPIEHFLVNIPPSYIGPLIIGTHISFWWLFLNLCLINTTLAHSGYHFPFLPSPEAHDFHHSSG